MNQIKRFYNKTLEKAYGFTLIELMIVIAIVAIFLTVAIQSCGGHHIAHHC